jgi:translation initiation factor IF-2
VFLAIKLAIFMALLAGAGGAFLYVRNLQATVAVLEANNVKLESAVDEQKQVLEQQARDTKSIVSAHKSQVALNAKLDASINDLRDKFQKVNASGKKRDIGNLAEQKPALMTKVINRGTKNAMRCMEIAMGSSLTGKEKNATKKSQINPECADIANPSYVRY